MALHTDGVLTSLWNRAVLFFGGLICNSLRGLPESFLLSRFQEEIREVLSCQGGFPGLPKGGLCLRAQGTNDGPSRAWIHSPKPRNATISNLRKSTSRSPAPLPSMHREAVVLPCLLSEMRELRFLL